MENAGLISPNLVTFLLTAVNIGVLFFLLRLVLFKPVTKFMEARAKKIADTIMQAEKDKNQAKQLLEQYETQLKSADAEAEEIIKSARETAAHEAQRIIDEGKNAAEIMLSNARRQIEAEREAALVKFRAEAAVLILAASSKLIARDIQKDDSRHFVNMLLEEISAERAAREGR